MAMRSRKCRPLLPDIYIHGYYSSAAEAPVGPGDDDIVRVRSGEPNRTGGKAASASGLMAESRAR